MYDNQVVQDLQYDIVDYLKDEEASGGQNLKKAWIPQLKERAKRFGYIGYEDFYEVAHEDIDMFINIMDNYFGELYNEALHEALFDYLSTSEIFDDDGVGEITLKESTHRPARPIRRKAR